MRDRIYRCVVAAAMLGALVASPSVYGVADTADTIFEQAEQLYRQLRLVDPECADPSAWASLVSAFGRVPAEFPDSPLAGDALWRVGDIHGRLARAGDAAAVARASDAYAALASRYPASAYAAEAYLRLAELTSGSEERRYYRQLLQDYPNTPQAQVAARELERLMDSDDVAASSDRRLEPSTGATDAHAGGREAPAGESPQPLGKELEATPTPASDPSSGRPETEGPPVFAELGRLVGVRYYSDATHTRVVFDLDRNIQPHFGEVTSPPRVFVDLVGAEVSDAVPEVMEVNGTGVRQIRVGTNRPGVVRLVLDLEAQGGHSIFTLTNPNRLVLDVPSPAMANKLAEARRPPAPEGGGEGRQLGFGVRRIVIDPGHGGTAPGAIGRSGKTEKELTLDIANRLAANLRSNGYEVLLTRDQDESLPLENRPAFATREQADLFVSVHINSSTNTKLSGFETYYLDLATDPTAAETAFRENDVASGGIGNLDAVLDDIVKNANKRESRDLAQAIQDSLVLQTSKQYPTVRDLGVKHAPFVVLIGANMPAVLVECSFLSHPDEEERLRDPAYLQQIADAIHIGIENYGARRRMVSSAH